jgi:RimJ/RimL family protein N-acetyltransferase
VSDALRTQRLTLTPHVEARDHWEAHGFGNWAIELDGRFAGLAELHFAHPGVTGISTDEIEAGWEIESELQGRGLATEAMRAAIDDVWARTPADHLVAYIRPENAASRRVAHKLGFTPRGEGLTRSGDPMTVYELRAPQNVRPRRVDQDQSRGRPRPRRCKLWR